MASYTTILALALADAPANRLSLRDLYLCVERNAHLLPFTSRPHWRRSVRHTLSKQPCFSRVDTNGAAADASARRCLWIMDEPRLPQPTREVLNLYRSGTPLPEVLHRLMTAASTSAMAKAGAFSQPRLRAGVRDMDDTMPMSAATTPTSTGVPQPSTLVGGAGGLLAALLNGGTPGDGMAPQQKSEVFLLSDASAPKREHHGRHPGHMSQQQPDAAGNPMALLSGWATLAGYTPEEVSSALTAAVAAADAENQRQRQREIERQQEERRCLRQRLEQQQRLQQEEQQQQQLTLAHVRPVSHPYGGGGPGGPMDPQAQDYYNLIMHSISSINNKNNNSGVQNVHAVAAATADMAAGRGFSFDMPGLESEISSSHTGTSQHGLRDSGMGNEIDDDVSVQGRAAVAARYNSQPARTSAFGFTAGPSMSEAAFQDYLLQAAADVNFAYGDEMA